MFQFACPGCAAPRAVADAENVNTLCGVCTAGQTWKSLPPADQQTINAALRRGRIAALIAMRDLTPPIRLPHATDLLVFLERASAG
jgi:hypothetical protein